MEDVEQVLAFRVARSGLSRRDGRSLAEAAACPASDFARDAALLALAARSTELSREAFDAAVDAGKLVVAHAIRGAIHAVAPADAGLYGRALVAGDERELGAQLGEQVRRLAAEDGFSITDALREVAAAIDAALAGGRRLDKSELHGELRERVRPVLLPWCKGCGSHHVAPMLWRYGTTLAGARLDAKRGYVAGEPPPADPPEVVRRFLRFYGPATPAELAEWAGLAKPHAQRLWESVAGDLEDVRLPAGAAWLLRDDLPALASPPAASGVRFLPPGDPLLQKPNRPFLAPDPALRKRLFRPLGSPGAVLRDGRLVALWRARRQRRRDEIAVEPLERMPRGMLSDEAQRVARLRGATDCSIVWER